MYSKSTYKCTDITTAVKQRNRQNTSRKADNSLNIKQYVKLVNFEDGVTISEKLDLTPYHPRVDI